MSQNGGTADVESGTKKGLTAEALQQYLAALAEDRDASAERTESILSRFFKVAIVMVCLNVVIAGANIAMITIRPRAVTAVPSTPTQLTAEAIPAASRAMPVMATPAPAADPAPAIEAPISAEVIQPAVSAKPAVAPKPAIAPQEEKKVPLLGPLPVPKAAPAGTPMLARRPARPMGRPTLAKPFLSDEYDDQDDGRSLGPPERW